MKNLTTSGYENNRPSTSAFSDWLGRKNQEREKDYFGIEKFIMRVERSDDVIFISTFNGSIYTIPYNEKLYKDLLDLIGYSVTFYPKDYYSYELDACFLWDWDSSLRAESFGYIVINKVISVDVVPDGGLILFENGDELPVPYKNYEKPYFKASKRQHGEDTYREGYEIDFDECINKIRNQFLGEYVVYSTKLTGLNVADYWGALEVHQKSAHKEYYEKDKYFFRTECGVIKKIATWDVYSIPIYLEDGRIFSFRIHDYSWHIDQDCGDNLIYKLKKYLEGEVGKSYVFLVVYGGNKNESNSMMDIASLKRLEDGEKFLSESISPVNLYSDWNLSAHVPEPAPRRFFRAKPVG
jgi:uncharacterized protein YrzB (UPF0473 family)